MQWNLIKALAVAAFVQSATAAPSRKVLATTTHGEQIIDWIVPESQGKLATPPPLPAKKRGEHPQIKQITPKVPEGGPAGTVPVLRNQYQFPAKRAPTAADHNITAAGINARDGVSGTHWYASSNENVNNIGGGAQVSIYDAFIQSDSDFNLLQIAVARDGVPNKNSQTCEAGWMHYPGVVSGDPFLFTYYTTVGYASSGDNVGGYNADQAGWVQVDSSYYPGIHLSPMSTIGGDQYEFTFFYQLSGGNWWFYFIDRYIGYYPASLFSAGTDAASSLADHASDILFYGEIYNSETDVTTTDMGSGNFPEGGFGQAAYMRNIHYFDQSNTQQDYNSGGAFVISDTNRYRLDDTWNSGTDWGSYMYLGGPGAGGVTGG